MSIHRDDMSKEERASYYKKLVQTKIMYQKNLEFFLSELKARGAEVNMELIVGTDDDILCASRALDKLARILNAHNESSFDRSMYHAMSSFKERATMILELFGFPAVDSTEDTLEEVGDCASLFPLGYTRDVKTPSLERIALKTAGATLDKFGFDISQRQENYFLCVAVVATLTQIERVAIKIGDYQQQETEAAVKPRVSVSELTRAFIDDIKKQGYLGDLRYYAHEPSPLLDKGAYSSKNYRPVMLRGFDTAPPALLLANTSAVVSVGYSRKSFKTLSENFTQNEAHTVAGSRKVLLTHVEPAPLAEAEAEDIALFKAKVTSQMVKRDMVVYKGQNRWNAYAEVGEIDPELVDDFEREKPTGNFVPGLTWAFAMPTNQKGKDYITAKVSGSSNYYDNRFISGMLRTDDMEGWDIDTEAPVVVVARNRVTHNASRERVQALAAYEDRYVARYDGDGGHTIIVTGTTPKRTLANIRRRIRDNVVDTLDIF